MANTKEENIEKILETIKNNGIHVYYPIFSRGENNQKQIDNIKSFNLPYVDLRYCNMEKNEHHFTTEYHHKYVFPFYDKLFNLQWNQNDWVLKEKFYTEKDGKVSDLSYLVPKIDKNFHVKCLTKKCEYDCNFSGLLYNKHVKNITWVTPYHELYCFPHLCSIVVNKSNNNNKRLLLLGDSQSIPDIPFLSYFFKEVWYIDNRNGIVLEDKLSKYNFDNILFAHGSDNEDEYYYGFIK